MLPAMFATPTLLVLNLIAALAANSTGPATCLASRYAARGLIMGKIEVGVRHEI
jgi:hypothetical protein